MTYTAEKLKINEEALRLAQFIVANVNAMTGSGTTTDMQLFDLARELLRIDSHLSRPPEAEGDRIAAGHRGTWNPNETPAELAERVKKVNAFVDAINTPPHPAEAGALSDIEVDARRRLIQTFIRDSGMFGGQCKILSLGDDCPCVLCASDAIARQAKLANRSKS